MKNLVNKVEEFLEKQIGDRISHGLGGRVQPIFVGLHGKAMFELFNVLTCNNTRDWNVLGNEVVVLLVDANSREGQQDSVSGYLSGICSWDYAISVRNSSKYSLALVTPAAFDLRPDSISNTMETLSCQLSTNQRVLRSHLFWKYMVEAIAHKFNLPKDDAWWILSSLLINQANNFELDLRESIPWIVLDRLLDNNCNDIAFSIGLPSIGSKLVNRDNLKLANEVLNDFAKKICAKHGIKEAEMILQEAERSLLERDNTRISLSVHLGELFEHLRCKAGDGLSFSNCPTWYFYPDNRDASWWENLTCDKIQELIDEAIGRSPRANIKLRCVNALNIGDCRKDEPFLVLDSFELLATNQENNQPLGQSIFSRKIGRSPYSRLENSSPHSLREEHVPEHDQPMVYKCESEGFKPATVKIISLESFACHGHARVEDSIINPAPSFEQDAFEQEISLSRGGLHTLKVFRSPSSSSITIKHMDEENSSDSNPAMFKVDLDNEDLIKITIRNHDGQEVASWNLRVFVHETDGILPRTRFEALVKAHQEGGPLKSVVPEDSKIRRIESSYLTDPDSSWRGVIGCWSTGTIDSIDINWQDATIGNLPISNDVRPSMHICSPPSTYLSARKTLLESIKNTNCTLAEINLDQPELASLVEHYLSEYLAWLEQEPDIAPWTDIIAIHSPQRNIEAGRETPTIEPVAVLVSPFHPIRIAWHCNAQRVLADALQKKRCPMAGMLDSHACPDTLALKINHEGNQQRYRAFLAIVCNEPHWALLWNKDYLAGNEENIGLLSLLEKLGFTVSGITEGFSVAQVERSLDEVSGIMSTRANFRIGLVGKDTEAKGCIDGIIKWSRKRFSPEGGIEFNELPMSSEVYDLRDNPRYPTAAMLATLSEETSERIRWFNKIDLTPKSLDLFVIDQIGSSTTRGVLAKSRSPLAPGVLFRSNIRRDIQGAQVLQESRVGYQDNEFPALPGMLVKATKTIEYLAQKDGVSHIEFSPNQEAIGRRLENSMFVAVTSTQVDPACFVRGVRRQDAYLWDYELPRFWGMHEDRAGYYLIAKPSISMKESILATARLISDNSITAESLLEEISKRGIPILKRLASGGSHSRGELGLLLAVRLLQDVFREGSTGMGLPVANESDVHFLLPVDSFWEPFSQLRKILLPENSDERPDLLVIAIKFSKETSIKIKVTPVEVKFRENAMTPLSLGTALRQAANLGELLHRVWEKLPEDANNDLWQNCGRALLLKLIDYCFRVYSNPSIHGMDDDLWVKRHQDVLHALLGGNALITVKQEGRLIVFDGSEHTTIVDMDDDGEKDSAILCLSDASFLLSGIGNISTEGTNAVNLLSFGIEEIVDQAQFMGQQDPEEQEVDAQPFEPQVPTPQVPATIEDDDTENSTTIDMETTSPISHEIRQKVRDAFLGFVGNENPVKRLKNDLMRALIENPPHLSKNYLFTGQPSTGKTEIAKRMSSALGLVFIHLDGKTARSREDLFRLIRGGLEQEHAEITQEGIRDGLPLMQYPPLIVFIDEIHLMHRNIQESLLTMLEADDRTLILGDQVAIMDKVTFLFATTRVSELDAAFRSRCSEVQLKEYSLDEVAEIVSRKFSSVAWPREVYLEIAKLGRFVPRIAIELAKELETEVTVTEHRDRTPAENLDEVRKAREIDKLGLNTIDIQYLNILEHENRPIGERHIANLMGITDRDRIIDEIEPFLRRINFIKFGPRGREITSKGKEYLLARRRNSQV